MKDFLEQLSASHLADLAIDFQVQLEKKTSIRPVLWLLARAKRRAATAMADLVRVDVTKTSQILILQNEVLLYEQLMQDCEALLALGHEADHEIDEMDRLDIIDALSPEEARQAGLVQTPEDM